MWDSFLAFLFEALNELHSLTQDYGFAIILLTMAIRVLLMPLTVKQTRSMHELQRVQPKIKALQEKYKNDKERLQAETLKFYEENKVNPLGGCLPLLLQMPVFIALFQVLNTELPKYLDETPGIGRGFWRILPDITLRPQTVWADSGLTPSIPYLVLVVLFGVSVWLPQQLAPGDQQQKRIALWMSVMMIYFGWISPAGVLIYWVTSSAWQLAQQAIMNRYLGAHDEESKSARSVKIDAGGDAAHDDPKQKAGKQAPRAGSSKKKRT